MRASGMKAMCSCPRSLRKGHFRHRPWFLALWTFIKPCQPQIPALLFYASWRHDASWVSGVKGDTTLQILENAFPFVPGTPCLTRSLHQTSQRRLLFFLLPQQNSGRASECRFPGSAQMLAHVWIIREGTAATTVFLRSPLCLNISLLVSLINMHQGLAVWKKKGVRWKEKGPQTHTHRHEHSFTEDQRTGQGQKPSSGAAKGAFSQETASAFLDVGADSQVLLSILSLGVTWCVSPLSFASTLGYLFLFWDYRSQFGSVTNKN